MKELIKTRKEYDKKIDGYINNVVRNALCLDTEPVKESNHLLIAGLIWCFIVLIALIFLFAYQVIPEKHFVTQVVKTVPVNVSTVILTNYYSNVSVKKTAVELLKCPTEDC